MLWQGPSVRHGSGVLFSASNPGNFDGTVHFLLTGIHISLVQREIDLGTGLADDVKKLLGSDLPGDGMTSSKDKKYEYYLT